MVLLLDGMLNCCEERLVVTYWEHLSVEPDLEDLLLQELLTARVMHGRERETESSHIKPARSPLVLLLSLVLTVVPLARYGQNELPHHVRGQRGWRQRPG